MANRQCPFCGMLVADYLKQCPFCREAIPEVSVREPHRRSYLQGREKIRQGLLYVLLAEVIQYFAGGYAPMKLPISVPPMAVFYLSSLLLVGGLSLALYGFHLIHLHRVRAL